MVLVICLVQQVLCLLSRLLILIGNVIICFLSVIVTGTRICLWVFFLIPSHDSIAVVNLGDSGSGTIPVGFLSDTDVFTQAFNATAMGTASDTSPLGISGSTPVSARQAMVARINNADVASFSILALRQAEALQKWKEITQSVEIGRASCRERV